MEVIGNAVHHAHESAHNLASAMMPHDVDPNYVDLEIQVSFVASFFLLFC